MIWGPCSVVILGIIMEGTVSQIFDLGPSSFFSLCNLENDVRIFYKQFPDFWHKMITKS